MAQCYDADSVVEDPMRGAEFFSLQQITKGASYTVRGAPWTTMASTRYCYCENIWPYEATDNDFHLLRIVLWKFDEPTTFEQLTKWKFDISEYERVAPRAHPRC